MIGGSVFILAFCAALMPVLGYEAHGFALAFMLLAGGVLWCFSRPHFALPRGPVVLVGLAFWALSFISVLFSEAGPVSFIYFCFFSVFPLAFLWAILKEGPRQFFVRIGGALAALFALLAGFSLVQYFFLPSMLFYDNVTWPLADPNALAALYSLAFFGGLGWMLAASNRVQSNLALALNILLLWAVCLTGSRGALIALAGALAVFAALCPAFFRRHWRCCSILIAVALGGFALSLLTHKPETQALTAFAAQSTGIGEPLLWDRPSIWVSTWQIIRDHFWTGTGIGTFFLYYPEYRDGDAINSAGFMAHNDPLQFWAEMGVAAPILFYAFIVLALLRTGIALKNYGPQDMRRVYIVAPFCALGALVAQAHVNFPFYVLPVLVLAGLMLAFWFQATKQEPTDSVIIHSDKVKAALILPVLAAMVAFSGLQGAEILISDAQKKLDAGDMQGFANNVNLAGEISLNHNARALLMAAGIPLGLLESGIGEDKQALFKQGIAFLDRAERLNSRLPEILYTRARFEAAMPGIENVMPDMLLKQALTLDSQHLPSRQMLADTLVKKGRREEALEVLKAGLGWRYTKQDPRGYYEQTAALALELGDTETRETALAKLLTVFY